MINLHIQKSFVPFISRPYIKELAQNAIIHTSGNDNYDLNVEICSDEVIQKFNRDYRGLDKPTDVLSFESGFEDPETGDVLLGDILISFETSNRQSFESGHSVKNEISLLLIHGILHLLGFNHETKNEKETMWKKQSELLLKFGIMINHISGDELFHD